MTKIYDCSNSKYKPQHRGNGGPKENDIVHYLKKYSKNYDCEFTDNILIADVIFTNDVFPPGVLKLENKKFVKRMDGVFWHENLIERNIPLNEAAKFADNVIFISEYSKNSYFKLYGDKLKDFSVNINISEPLNIEKKEYNDKPKKWISIANDWDREEKRLENTLIFSELVEELILVGKIDKNIKLPNNVKSIPYISNKEDLYKEIIKCDAMVSLSYRDSCPKTVAHSLECKVPVLYSDTGGHIEMVKNNGLGIPEENKICFNNIVKNITKVELKKYLFEFEKNYFKYLKFKNKKDFNKMLSQYFNIIKG